MQEAYLLAPTQYRLASGAFERASTANAQLVDTLFLLWPRAVLCEGTFRRKLRSGPNRDARPQNCAHGSAERSESFRKPPLHSRHHSLTSPHKTEQPDSFLIVDRGVQATWLLCRTVLCIARDSIVLHDALHYAGTSQRRWPAGSAAWPHPSFSKHSQWSCLKDPWG